MRNLTRKENIIVGVCAVLLLAAIIVLFMFSQRRTEVVSANLSHPKTVSNSVWVIEGEDCASGVSELAQASQSVSEFGFDTVFFKSEELYGKKYTVSYKKKTEPSDFSKDTDLRKEVLSLIKSECAQLSSRGLCVILAVDITSLDSIISTVSKIENVSGLIVTGCSDYPAEFVNERLACITEKAKSASVASVVYASFEKLDTLEKISLDKEHMTYLAAKISDKSDFERLNSLLLPTEVGLTCDFDCDELCENQADGLLRAIISSDECSKLSSRAFHSLSKIISNRDNSTTTALKYINDGIDLDKALTALEVENLPATVVETQDMTYSFKIRCSDSFSLYIGGSCYGVVGESFCDISVDLRHGENDITLSQNGKSVSFTVNCTKEFDSELVSYITPSEATYYSGNQTVSITVGAFYNAKLKLMLGEKELELKPLGTSTGDYAVFSASVKLPKSGKKVKQLGQITVEATYNSITKVYSGGSILVNAKSSVTLPSQETTEITQGATLYRPQATVSGMTPYTYNGVSGNADYISVSSPSAEVYPTDPNAPYYNPEYCLWTQGTIDRVVSQSQYTNGDGDTFDMYDLASGRRIVKDDAVFIPSGYALPNNSVTLLSCNTSSGLDVSLSTLWRVPYSINRYSQSYYSGYENKRYNVSVHTVSVIDFVFFNTPTHTGEVPEFSNDIVQKAEWVSDAQSETSILRFYLKKQGGFYGITVNYDESGNIHLCFKQPKASLSGMKILLDPGHGGIQSGATGMNGTVYESHQTLKIGKYLASYLASAGASVYMTRTEDVDVSLEDRRRMTEQIDPELFVSIHLNASEKKERSGTCTFYYKAFSQPLAKCIHNRLMQVYLTSCYDDNASMRSSVDQGANYYPFYVTRTDICPSVLVEVGFITNDLECAYLSDDAYQQVFARAIYLGIVDYVSTLG